MNIISQFEQDVDKITKNIDLPQAIMLADYYSINLERSCFSYELTYHWDFENKDIAVGMLESVYSAMKGAGCHPDACNGIEAVLLFEDPSDAALNKKSACPPEKFNVCGFFFVTSSFGFGHPSAHLEFESLVQTSTQALSYQGDLPNLALPGYNHFAPVSDWASSCGQAVQDTYCRFVGEQNSCEIISTRQWS